MQKSAGREKKEGEGQSALPSAPPAAWHTNDATNELTALLSSSSYNSAKKKRRGEERSEMKREKRLLRMLLWPFGAGDGDWGGTREGGNVGGLV